MGILSTFKNRGEWHLTTFKTKCRIFLTDDIVAGLAGGRVVTNWRIGEFQVSGFKGFQRVSGFKGLLAII